ncbi:uncharacterized protein LOC132170626 [Corylus avellana]|uniref:uncharacterized protein LOC132170626 n=1 Tax=Corylus avellana TaxID=13451 RepID=UPI001E218D72|nr:uncharacterized protein LOC132170626 [Corylus avellana]
MASNLCRFFSSSALKLNFSHTRSDPLTRSLSNPVSRLICSATQQPHPLEENPNKPQAETTEKDLPNESQEEDGDNDDYDDSGNFVNKMTGEVGGPRGPEPTRFGDWEKNGRCSDF